ncbi:MAG: paraquat-inducible protein A [Methylovulum sp.]|nr:paraquat-inducible protein A [Methylovulum sp.]
MIVEVDQLIREKNLSGNESWWEKLLGQFQQLVTDILVDVQSFRSRVPEFTDLIFAELSKPGSKTNIKNFLHEKLRDFAENSFNRTDYSQLNAIIGKHGCGDLENCRIQLTQEIDKQNILAAQKAIWVLVLAVGIFGLGMIRKSQPNPKLVLALGLTCVTLLWGGISTPMIVIDAKMSQLAFQLLGESVVFENQVLYFQSKSITDVVTILTSTGKADMILVGVLVSVFSIAFPIAKILASLFYYYDVGGLRYNPVIQFFALKSSKWSMADVMVAALFMAYIGFSGLISSQLEHLTQASQHVKVLATDGTSLQAGFFLFLGFCLASMVLSGLLEKMVEPLGFEYGGKHRSETDTSLVKSAEKSHRVQLS